MGFVDYVARGSVLLDEYIDNSRLAQLNPGETQFSSVISEVLPSERGFRPNRNFSEYSENDLEGQHNPSAAATQPEEINPLFNELNQGLKTYTDSLAKLLVNPNDQRARSTLQTLSERNIGLLTEASSLTLCILDTWIGSFQHNLPSNTFENSPITTIGITPKELSNPPITSNDNQLSKLIEENKELKRKVAFYKSQISKLYGQDS